MASKFDQQALKKHHFWILLGVLLPLVLAALCVIWFGVSDAVGAERKKVEDAQKAANRSVTKNKGTLETIEGQRERMANQRGKVWKSAADRQTGLIEFFAGLSEFNQTYPIFGAGIKDIHAEAFVNRGDYANEWKKLPDIIKPTELAPDWNSANLQRTTWNPVRPSSEDVWLALEEVCVQREVLTNIRAANLAVARFEWTDYALGLIYCGTPPDPKKGELDRRQMRNRWCELDLILAKKSNNEVAFRGSVKNVSGERQKAGQITLDVRLSGDENAPPVTVTLRPTEITEYIRADQTMTLQETAVSLKGVNEGRLFHVAQTLSRSNVPVKQVTRIALGASGVSHRHADKLAALVMSSFSQKQFEEPADGGAKTPAAAPPGGGTGEEIMRRTQGGGAGATAGASGPTSPNNFERQRYLQRTDQVRRLPIRIDCLIDQAYLQDLLVALANSRLRLQVTQVEWQRARDVPAYSTTTSGTTASGPPGAGGRMPPPGGGGTVGEGMIGTGGAGPSPNDVMRMMMGSGRSGAGGGPGGRMPPPGGLPPGLGNVSGQNPTTQNFDEPPPATLITVNVYGVASLYEKFAEKKDDADTAKK